MVNLASWRERQRKKFMQPSKSAVERTRKEYAKVGLKPKWVDLYRTRSRLLAFEIKEYFDGFGFPVRITEHSSKKGTRYYDVELLDSHNPLVSHRFFPEKKSMRNKLRKIT